MIQGSHGPEVLGPLHSSCEWDVPCSVHVDAAFFFIFFFFIIIITLKKKKRVKLNQKNNVTNIYTNNVRQSTSKSTRLKHVLHKNHCVHFMVAVSI